MVAPPGPPPADTLVLSPLSCLYRAFGNGRVTTGRVLWWERRNDAVPADQQDVRHDQDPDAQGQQHDVPHQHLAEVEHVEVRADPDRVQAVLRLSGDPLRGQ